MIRGFPNEATHYPKRIVFQFIGMGTWGTETSKYPEEGKSTETPLVVASESGPGQWSSFKNRNALERAAIAGDSPVRVERTRILE